MTNNLLFDFHVDKENNQIRVAKTFDAGLPMTWDAWTKPEYLDQWWAPRPYRVETKSMDFRPGGRWFYAMISPEDQRHWCVADYKSIKNLMQFTYLDSFADENGVLVPAFGSTHWTVDFSATNGSETTQVNILLQYESLEIMEKIIEVGFREGFSAAIGNLDELLSALKSNP